MERETGDLALTRTAVEGIDDELFTRYKGGWPHEIGIALWDAVYSMSARYSGVKAGLARLRDGLHERGMSTDSLSVVAHLDERVVIEAMGAGRVAPGRPRSTTKAAAAREVARRFRDVNIETAADLRSFAYPTGSRRPDEDRVAALIRAYSGVYGCGPVTAEYFLMLLGVPGLKADRRLVSFVSRAVGRTVSSREARRLLVDVYETLAEEGACKATLLEFDHAIWLHETSRHEGPRAQGLH
ncbi:hypothetical protein [Corynebacterium timonense]|uniref:Uncharacterized protein n=1 Tax=Corynebacterium timonense TaxID=441500 RepID=A0A1H1MQ13_9CORY|nr:hypothetical protein [Corynebacterium timonense]SDR88807.1 hypothetical protein SAMN04488539_0582 [Corynebacterium timonense]